MVGGTRFVSASKAALKLMGRDVGEPRPPRLPLPARELPALIAALNAAGLAFETAAAL
jgi:4-hydroxy-tetrahydrodipicolinate synthase